MPREKEDFRDNLVMLKEKFGDVATVSIKSASEYVGKDERVLKRDKSFPIKKLGRNYLVSIVGFAKWLS